MSNVETPTTAPSSKSKISSRASRKSRQRPIDSLISFYANRSTFQRQRAERLLKKRLRPKAELPAGPMHFEILEPRLLLSADIFPGTQANYITDGDLGDGLIQEFSSGLDALESVLDGTLGSSALTDPLGIELPGLLDRSSANTSDWKAPLLKDVLDVDAILRKAGFTTSVTETDAANQIWDRNGNSKIEFGEVVERYVDEVLRDQAAAIGASGRVDGSAIAGAFDTINQALGEFQLTVDNTAYRFAHNGNAANYEFDIVINLVRSHDYSLDLGRNADAEVFDYGWNDASASLPDVTVESFYKLTMTLGLDATMSEAGGQTTVTPVANGFYVESGAKLEVGARANETDLDDFNLRFGFLDLIARNGTFEMDAVVTTDFTDADGKITTTELAGSTDVNAAGSVEIVLPVEVAPVAGFAAFADTFNEDAGTPIERSISLKSDAIFSDPTFGVSGEDPRTALALQFENFDDIEPFRDLGGLHIISVLQQIQDVLNILESLQPREVAGDLMEPLFGADLPFVDDLSISDMLAFADSLGAKIDTFLTPVGNAFSPTFDSVQEFVADLAGVLGGPLSVLDILPTYDLTSHELTFAVDFTQEFKKLGQDADFNFNLSLGPIANLLVSGTLDFDTLLKLAFTAGIDLDEGGDISIVTAFAPFGIISLSPAANGEVSNNARFRLDYGFGRADVEVVASETAGFSLDQLAEYIHDKVTGEIGADGPTINVIAVGGRLQIITLDTAFLQITKLAGDAGGFDELGFRNGQIASDGFMPEDGVLSGAAEFDINYNGRVEHIVVNPDSTNDTIADLIADIQAEVDDEFGAGLIKVDYQSTATVGGATPFDIGGVIVFKPGALAPSLVDFIAIDNVSDVARNELGLRDHSVSSDIQLTGTHETIIPVTTPGNVLANGSTFQLNFVEDGVTTLVGVTVTADSTSDNVSLQDLADDINRALGEKTLDDTTRLDRVISAVVENGNIVLKTTSYRAFDSISVSGVSPAVGGLGFPGPNDTVGPKLNGEVTDAEFVLELQSRDGSVLKAEFLGANAIDNPDSSLSALVDEINERISTTALAGKVVAGLADGARIVFAVLPNDTMFNTGDDPLVLRITSTNAETREHLGFVDDLAARGGGTFDAFVQDISLEATLDASAALTGTADFGFVGLSIGLDLAIEGEAAFAYNGRLDLGTILGAGTSLDRIEALVSGLLDGFSLTASATATASSIDVSGAGAGLLQDLQDALDLDSPTLTISLENLLSLAPPEVDFDLNGLQGFADFDFTDITLILDQVAGFLGNLVGIDFLDQPLPLVDIRLGDALELVEDFLAAVQDIKNNPAGQIQELLDSLNEGLARFTSGNAVLSFTDGELSFNLGFETGFSAVLPLNIDVVDMLAGTGISLPDGLLSLSGSANLQAEFSALVNLAFGVDVGALAAITDGPFDEAAILSAIFLRSGDPTSGGTGISVTGMARASNVNFTAALGPLGLYVTNGSAVLNDGGGLNDNDPASFVVQLPDGAEAGRLTLEEIISSDALFDAIQSGNLASLDFGVSVVLPMSFPTASNFIGNAAFDLVVDDPFDTGSNGTTFTNVQFPDFTAVDIQALIDDLTILDSLNLFLEGIDLGLSTLSDLVQGQLFGLGLLSKLPLVGDALSDAGGFFDDIRNDIVQPLQELLGTAANLGPDIINAIRAEMEEALHASGFLDAGDAIGILVDGNEWLGDLDSILSADEIMFELVLGKTITIESFDANFGIPALGFSASDPIDITLRPEFTIGFGLSLDEGFFIEFADGEDLGIELGVSLPDVLVGRLGFLEVQATRDANHPPELSGGFGVNIADGRLSFASLPRMEFDFNFHADVDIDLHLQLGFNNELIDAASFPSIGADFVLDWSFDSDLENGYTNPTLELNDITLQLGSFLTDTLGPILGSIQDILDPVQPVIDVMTDPLPVLSDLMGKDVSLLDIAGQLGMVDPALVDTLKLIAQVLNAIESINPATGEITILETLSLGGDGVDLSNPFAINGLSDITAIVGQLGGLLNLGDVGDEIAGFMGDVIGDLSEQVGGTTGGLTFPFLDDPSQIIGVFFGKPMTLIQFDMPKLEFGFDISAFFPLLGPLGVQLDGAAHAVIDLAFGYDTFGIAKFAEREFKYPLDLFRGFFVYDDSPANPGVDVDEVMLDAFIRASAAINVGVASAGVGGGIYANINFDLRDPNDDMRVRIEEIIGNMFNDGDFNPLAIFDVEGEITAKLVAFVKILFVIDKEIQLGSALPLLNFNTAENSFSEDPVLATDLGDGVLRLNMGEFAKDRLRGDLTDGDESFTVTSVSDGLEVKAFGYTQTYKGTFTKIVAFAGQGNDTVDLSGVNSSVATEIEGGAGNDKVLGSAGTNLIFGDTGDDIIVGGAAIDRLFGGAGNDRIDGAGEADIILGQDGNDILRGGAGNDRIAGGTGDDAIDGGLGEDVLLGEQGNDAVAGGLGNDVMDLGAGNDLGFGDLNLKFTGTLGLDLVGAVANPGVEMVAGAHGADDIAGGGGSDNIQGNGGNDEIWGDSLFAFTTTSERDAETVAPADMFVRTMLGSDPKLLLPARGDDGNDIISGGAGADRLFGQNGNDLLYGDLLHNFASTDPFNAGMANSDPDAAGDDHIEGGRGADKMYGNDANDTLLGGADNDYMFGNAGNDDLAGDVGIDVLFGDNGKIELMSGKPTTEFLLLSTIDPGVGGDDTISGGLDGDYIFGGLGADTIGKFSNFGDGSGDAGDDYIFGDNGKIDFTYSDALRRGFVTNVESLDKTFGGIDQIAGGAGRDIIIGGDGGDTINGDYGDPTIEPASLDSRDVIFGDHGQVTSVIIEQIKGSLVTKMITSDGSPDEGGDDIIDGKQQGDFIFGGVGADTVTGGSGDDIVIGDAGVIEFGRSLAAAGYSAAGSIAQVDLLNLLTLVSSTLPTNLAMIGGDTLSGGQGNDIVVGGGGNDTIYGDAETNGTETSALPEDQLADYERLDVGRDILLGDNGRIDFAFGNVGASQGVASPSVIESTDVEDATGGADKIFGSRGDDVIIGSVNGTNLANIDELTGDDGEDVILGDNGKLSFALGADTTDLELDRIETTHFDVGRDDRISGGADRDFVFGGKGDDYILGDDLLSGGTVTGPGADILFGDQGAVLLAGKNQQTGRSLITSVESVAETDAQGGADKIFGNAGSDVIIGGVNGSDATKTDELHGNADADIIVGDEGRVLFNEPLPTFDNDPTTVDRVETKSFGLGGMDLIFGGGGGDVVLGGTGADVIEGDNDPADVPATDFGRDILIGDQGRIDFFQSNKLSATSSYASSNVAEIVSTDTAASHGAADTISGNGGGDIIIGGVGADVLMGAAEVPARVNETSVAGVDDIIIGDEGRLAFNLLLANDGDSDAGTLDLIETGDPSLGDADTIHGDNGNDIALGGAGDDDIYGDLYRGAGAGLAQATAAGKDILFGDSGTIRLKFDTISLIRSKDVSIGGNDNIEGNERGDIMIGGAGMDRLFGESETLSLMTTQAPGANNDIILGDNGELSFLLASDTIVGRSDVGTINFDPNNFDLDRISTFAPNDGDADVIHGNSDNDIIFGGTGADTIWGDTDDATPNAADGRDGSDVIFGDHGKLYYTVGVMATANPSDPYAKFYNNFFFSIDTSSDKGGRSDLIFGNGGDDFLIGGQGDDLLFGGKGNDDIIGGHNISGTLGAPAGELAHDDLDGLDTAARDALRAEVDAFNGGLGSLTNRLALLNPTDFHEINEAIDGGEGDDVIAGDNAIIKRQGVNIFTGQGTADFTSPRYRAVDPALGGQMYKAVTDVVSGHPITVGVEAAVAAAFRNNLDMLDSVVRSSIILDQSAVVANQALTNPGGARAFGNDWIVGNVGDDEILGGLGDDFLQGDGRLNMLMGQSLAPPAIGSLVRLQSGDSINIRVVEGPPEIGTFTLQFVVGESNTDGNDYLEGNGGNDLMFGNLGADDLIGGSSALFGANDAALRLDGADMIYGGGNNPGVQGRNAEFGTTPMATLVDSDERHAADADVIVGDNGNIYHIVAADGSAARFAHDNSAMIGAGYSATNAVDVRAVTLLDYTYDYTGAAPNETLTFKGAGAGDLIFGETGDDVIFGMTGDDVIYGHGEDDDIVGGQGADFLLGGTGIDGILGDDGVVTSVRIPMPSQFSGSVTSLGEALYGQFYTAADVNKIISTPGGHIEDRINIQGTLIKGAFLSAFRTDLLETGPAKLSFDDIIFGGLGSDFLHGGDGDDAMSGAEALPYYYGANGDFTAVNDLLVAQQRHGINDPLLSEKPFWYGFAPYNPGHILSYQGNFNAANPTKITEFAYYDENAPMRKIMINAAGDALTSPTNAFDFFLNFRSDEGVLDTRFANAGDGPGSKQTDGDDRIFGDAGNDWIVGGTGRDHLWGGRGDDLLNTDDDLNTAAIPPKKGTGSVLDNNQPDSFQAYADIAYGGAGRDILMLNTGGDRLIDWTGEFNSYIVPYSPFGMPEIVRSLSPHIEQFLLDLSRADGADQRMPDGQLYVDQRATSGAPLPSASRNFEPYGETGMVRQHDPDWGDQHGKPMDPQAGNFPGQHRDYRDHEVDPIPTTPALAAAVSGTPYVAPDPANSTLMVSTFTPSASTSSAPTSPALAAGTTSGGGSAGVLWSSTYVTPTTSSSGSSNSGSGSNAGIMLPDFLFAPLSMSPQPPANS